MSMSAVTSKIQRCRLCEAILDPRPVLRVSRHSRILVIGQAPGSKVHATGKPWDDPSGDHLRQWLDVDRSTFDDPHKFGILPMAFCYPGKGTSGDKPPPPICAQTWHASLTDHLARPPLTLLIGTYAQAYYLRASKKKTLTATVAAWREYGPDTLPLPHPSWRSKIWMKKHPWFADEVLPALRQRVRNALAN